MGASSFHAQTCQAPTSTTELVHRPEQTITNSRTPKRPDFRRRSPCLVREEEPLSGLLAIPASSLLVLWRVRLLLLSRLWLDLLL